MNTILPRSGDGFLLRYFAIDDAQQFVKIESCPKNKKYLGLPSGSYDDQIARFKKGVSNKDEFYKYFYAIEETSSRQLIGRAGLVKLASSPEEFEVSIVIDKPFWNKKFGTKILKVMINTAFIECKAESIHATIHPENQWSQKLFKEHGFIQVGVKNIDGNSSDDDDLVFKLTKNDYDSSTATAKELG